jgi:hypothetical protein
MFMLFGILLILTPFTETLEKYKATRVLFRGIQIVGAITFILLSAYTVVGKVMLSIVFPMALLTVFGAKALSYFGFENAEYVSYFYSFTVTAILFSFWGNWLLRKSFSMFGSSKETVEKELPYVRWLLGQDQIRYGVYVLYFVLLVLSTNFELLGDKAADESHNLVTLTLQSFAVFLAFEILVEKRHLMSPYGEFLKGLKEVFSEIRNKSFEEIFKGNRKPK